MTAKKLSLGDLTITSFVTTSQNIRGGACTDNCHLAESCGDCNTPPTGASCVPCVNGSGATCGHSCGVCPSMWATCPGGACPSQMGQLFCAF